jgi:hypothetical protein
MGRVLRPQPSRGTPLIDVVTLERKKPNDPSYAVVVRDWQGGEFCRRTAYTQTGAQDLADLVRTKLAACNGDVVAGLEEWQGSPVQVPLWFGK